MTTHRRMLGPVLAGLVILHTAGQAQADDLPVDLELVLAVDVSRSMDYEEQRLQRDGYIGAFQDEEVLDAIRSGVHGRIAVTYVEWAGVGMERLVVPWMVVDGPETAAAFGRSIDSVPIQPLSRTSVSFALERAASLFEGNGIQGIRRVIDVSGDGPNNQGPPVEPVRDRVLERGITINALPIMIKLGTPGSWFDIQELDEWYEDCVIGGFGAFLIPVTHEAEFASAIRRKLILEISGLRPTPTPRFMHAQAPAPRPKTDCLIGEKLWLQRWGN